MLPKACGAGGKDRRVERKSAAKLQAEYDAKYGGEKGSIPAPAAAAPAVARSPHGDVVPLSTAEVTGIGGAKPSAGVLPRPFAALHFLHCSVRCVADGACNPTRFVEHAGSTAATVNAQTLPAPTFSMPSINMAPDVDAAPVPANPRYEPQQQQASGKPDTSISCDACGIKRPFQTMHDLDLPTYLVRPWPIISTRTRRCAFALLSTSVAV